MVGAGRLVVKPSNHNNYYGLVFGGDALEGATQHYTYFLIAQNGMWLIKERAGDATTNNIVDKTANDAVKKPGADGTSINTLEVRVSADKADFVVNGTTVHSAPKSENSRMRPISSSRIALPAWCAKPFVMAASPTTILKLCRALSSARFSGCLSGSRKEPRERHMTGICQTF